MKKFLLAITAASFLTVPVAYAADRHGQQFPSHHGMASKLSNPHHSQNRDLRKPRWTKGQRLPAWQRSHVVRDYHRYGLARPGHGQQWVKIGNNYVLIAIASGVIASVLAR